MIEKSGTRRPSSGALAVSCSCMQSLLSGQPQRSLRDEATLDLVGSDADDPHQRMTQILLEPAIVDRTWHLLEECCAHAKNIERGLAEALHQFAGEDLADRAIFRRRYSVGRQFSAMHHQLTANLDVRCQHRNSVANERIGAKRRSAVLYRHDMLA